MTTAPRHRDEPTPVDHVRIVIIAGGVLLFVLVAIAGLGFIYSAVVPTTRPAVARQPPQPRLQSHPTADLARLRADQQTHLRGIVQAMQAIAARGADGYGPVATSSPQPPGAPP